MEILARQLKERARQLGITNAEAARRCGLDERRYNHYTSGRRQPDLAMLVKIAMSLGTTPNWLLGLDDEGLAATARSNLMDRLLMAVRAMSDHDLRLFVVQAEAVAQESQVS
jgi:transcriptional regulator with XRE-family HTH domain